MFLIPASAFLLINQKNWDVLCGPEVKSLQHCLISCITAEAVPLRSPLLVSSPNSWFSLHQDLQIISEFQVAVTLKTFLGCPLGSAHEAMWAWPGTALPPLSLDSAATEIPALCTDLEVFSAELCFPHTGKRKTRQEDRISSLISFDIWATSSYSNNWTFHFLQVSF